MNIKIGKAALGLVIAAAGVCCFAADCFGGWRYEDGSITDGDWVIGTAAVAGGLKVTGVTTAGTQGTEIDLQDVADLPGAIVQIGDSAFQSKTTITSVKLPTTLTSIGNHSFRECSALAHVEPFLPDSLTSLGAAAFRGSPVEDDLTIANPGFTTIANHSNYVGVFPGIKSKVIDLSRSGITQVGSYAFSGCAQVETVLLPETLQSIGECGFNACTSLKHVEPFLPSTVKFLDVLAFYQCPVEDDLVLSSPNLKTIPDAHSYRAVFGGFRSKSVDMSASGITKIGSYAFQNNPNLESVKLPETLQTVAEAAFISCSALRHIEPFLPGSFTTFGMAAFYGCPIEGELVISNANFTTTPTYDWSGMFGSSRITSVDFSQSGLTSLAQSFFTGCKTLSTVNLPATLVNIGQHAFVANTNLTEVIFNGYPTGISDNAFHDATPGNLHGRIRYPKSDAGWQTRIDGDATFVAWDDAGEANQDLYAELFPDGPKPRGYMAFENRQFWLVPLAGEVGQVDLAVVSDPEAVGAPDPAYSEVPREHLEGQLPILCTNSLFGATETIGYSNVCCHLEKMGETWWEPVASMPDALSYEFNPEEGGVYRIRWQWQPVGYTLKLPEPSEYGHVAEVGATVGGLDGFGTYYVSNTVVTLNAVNGTGEFVRWFGDVPDGCETDNPLQITMERAKSVSAYFESGNWTYDDTAKTLSDGNWILNVTASSTNLTVIGIRQADPNFTVLDLAKPVSGGCRITALGNAVFYGYAKLQTVKLPTTLTSIGSQAFEGCSALAHVEPFLPDSLTSIGGRAFIYCPIEDDLVIANPNFKTISDAISWGGVFAGIQSKVVDLSKSGITQVGGYAFNGCTNLETVLLPETLQTIIECGFSYCSKLTHVEPFLPSSVRSLGILSFYACPIEDDLVLNCPNLTSISDDNQWRGVFAQIRSKSVDMRGSGITKIGAYAFADCAALETVWMPAALKTVPDYPFVSCKALKSVYWQPVTSLSLAKDVFCYVPALTFRHYIPRGDTFWTNYLATSCTVTTPLTEDEKAAYAEKFPGARMAKGKAKLPSTTGYQYYLTWNPDPDGMKLIFR